MTLKAGSAEDIQKLFNRLTTESQMIIKNVVQLTYFMRGGASYDYILREMSFAERQIMNDFLEKRMEIETKSPHPVY